jgi:hypothetical protein
VGSASLPTQDPEIGAGTPVDRTRINWSRDTELTISPDNGLHENATGDGFSVAVRSRRSLSMHATILAHGIYNVKVREVKMSLPRTHPDQ